MPILVNAYCTHLNPPPPPFPHQMVNWRGRRDPEMLPHLRGFIDYMLSRGAQQMTSLKYSLMRHIQRVHHQFSMNMEPSELNAFGRWARAANAIAYLPDGSIRDCQSRVLLDAGGRTQEGAAIPYPEDALARKARSGRRLYELGIRVPESLPPVIGETELDLRPASEVALAGDGAVRDGAACREHCLGRRPVHRRVERPPSPCLCRLQPSGSRVRGGTGPGRQTASGV